MTITLDETVYDALHRTMSEQQMRQFIKELIRAHVFTNTLDTGYQAMAADNEREAAIAFSVMGMQQALRGMEDEPDLYTLADLKERWQ
ncbi:hypothetical protein [Thiospirillum jenense]|uniref:hypothetical protein n=1 Tax=Thiospirillum jenense TaxID=1653858 RepID=UPI001EEAD7C8|nr:hypothetical protein [Thiospirillum jenense]